MKETIFCGYTIGEDAYSSISEICVSFGKRALIIGGETALSKAMDKLLPALDGKFEIVGKVIYGKECTQERMLELADEYKNTCPDFVIGVGGGKAIDTAKGTAYYLNIPIITLPTIASTCAPASALSVVYTKEHVFSKFMHYKTPPYHCFIDTEIISAAPTEFLRAGIGDTLAKYYETTFSARGANTTYSDEMALQISRMCSAPLMRDAAAALNSCRNNKSCPGLENVIRIIIISTGMVSMLINEKFNGAVAHALFYGLTNLNGFEEKFLHGDVVGYAVIVQLLIDNQPEEAVKIKSFLKEIGIETTLKERGIIPKREEFEKVLEGAVNDPDMEVLPYEISKDMIFDAILKAENLEEKK